MLRNNGIDRLKWEACFTPPVTPRKLFERLRKLVYDQARSGEVKKTHAVPKDDGPMAYLGTQIVKKMEQAGWPSIIHCLYRSPDTQNGHYVTGTSKAKAFQSPHQYLEAVDIVHKTLFWNAPPEYWESLASAVRAVEADYGVELEHGHYWRFVDSAHVELKDWRKVRQAQIEQKGFNYKPLPSELQERFKQVLPQIR